MSLETVIIGSDCYHLHQLKPSYGVDNIGNPHYLGEDYSIEDLEVLIPQTDEEGNIYYEHDDIKYPEDVFIALCRVALIPHKTPVAVTHNDGDKNNNDYTNLSWVYD